MAILGHVPGSRGRNSAAVVEMKTTLSRGLTRTWTALAGAALFFGGVYILLHAASILSGVELIWHGLTADFDLATRTRQERAQWGFAGMLSSASGVLAIWLALPRLGHSRRSFALRDTSDVPGSCSRVTISERSIQAMVIHAARSEEGVRDIRCDANLGKKGWRIRCDLSIWYGTSLPVLLPHLEGAIGDVLTHHTGIAIDDLTIDTHYEALDANG